MILLDSNAIIYFADSAFSQLRESYSAHNLAASAISRIEVLGYHDLQADQIATLTEYFRSVVTFEITPDVVEQAIVLRQQKKMGLGDSIIAATALIEGLKIVTRNTKDFKWIPDLILINPFDEE